MDLRNLFFLFTMIYLFSFFSYSKTKYIQCYSLTFKIKKPLVRFDKGYVIEKNKLIRLENFKFLEKQYVLYVLKTNQKKCFNKNRQVDIKITKGINNSKFFYYKSVVSNNFCQIDDFNKSFKRNKCKNLYNVTVIT